MKLWMQHRLIYKFRQFERILFCNNNLLDLHNEELHNLYSSPNIIRMINSKEDEMGKACSTNGILVGKPEERDH
jgi:hypothetical protein